MILNWWVSRWELVGEVDFLLAVVAAADVVQLLRLVEEPLDYSGNRQLLTTVVTTDLAKDPNSELR